MMDTISTLRGVTPEPKSIDGSPACGCGHPWRPQTTRWRYRVRGSRHGSGWECDCLVCKNMANKTRRTNSSGRNQALLVDVSASGTHWITRA